MAENNCERAGGKRESADKSEVIVAKSWAQHLGSTIYSLSNKNILEVVLEKDFRGPFQVSDEDVARLMRKIGLEPTAQGQVEAVQVCPNGRGIIYFTMKDSVTTTDLCTHSSFVVTQSGIRTSVIRHAGKRDIVVTVKGMHPNTNDSVMLDYLSKFGKVVSTKVVHGVYMTDPIKLS